MVVAFGFSKFEVGVLVAVGYLVNMIFQPLTGRYSERFEARKLLALGISIIAVSMLLFTISSTFALMLVSIVVLRFGIEFLPSGGSIFGSLAATPEANWMTRWVFKAPLEILVSSSSSYFRLRFTSHLDGGDRFLIYAAFDLTTVAITLVAMTQKRLALSGDKTAIVQGEYNPPRRLRKEAAPIDLAFLGFSSSPCSSREGPLPSYRTLEIFCCFRMVSG